MPPPLRTFLGRSQHSKDCSGCDAGSGCSGLGTFAFPLVSLKREPGYVAITSPLQAWQTFAPSSEALSAWSEHMHFAAELLSQSPTYDDSWSLSPNMDAAVVLQEILPRAQLEGETWLHGTARALALLMICQMPRNLWTISFPTCHSRSFHRKGHLQCTEGSATEELRNQASGVTSSKQKGGMLDQLPPSELSALRRCRLLLSDF